LKYDSNTNNLTYLLAFGVLVVSFVSTFTRSDKILEKVYEI